MRLPPIAASLLAALPLLGGCAGEDHSDQVAPITEAVEALPGVATRATYWPKSLKMNESYSLAVSLDRGGSGRELCAALPEFRRALRESDFRASIADVRLTAGETWQLDLPGDTDEATDAEGLCRAAIRLRRLPGDTAVHLGITPPLIEVSIDHGSEAQVRRRARALLGEHAQAFDLEVR